MKFKIEKDPYLVLGVSKTASADEIKKAYRKKAFLFHPDQNSGDTKEFTDLKDAYDILKNPEFRDQYDRTGSVKKDQFELQFANFIASEIIQVVAEAESENKTIIEVFKSILNKKIEDLNKVIESHPETESIYQSYLDKVKVKDGKLNYIQEILESTIDKANQSIINIEAKKKIFEKFLERIESDYTAVEKITLIDTGNNYYSQYEKFRYSKI